MQRMLQTNLPRPASAYIPSDRTPGNYISYSENEDLYSSDNENSMNDFKCQDCSIEWVEFEIEEANKCPDCGGQLCEINNPYKISFSEEPKRGWFANEIIGQGVVNTRGLSNVQILPQTMVMTQAHFNDIIEWTSVPSDGYSYNIQPHYFKTINVPTYLDGYSYYDYESSTISQGAK